VCGRLIFYKKEIGKIVDFANFVRGETNSRAHLLFKCHYSLRIGNMIVEWLGLTVIDTSTWLTFETIKEWWESVIYNNGTRRKSLASLIMLTSWEIWNEQNVRVFRNVSTMPTAVVQEIKLEAALWCGGC
jgi:hypothetical protein